MTAGKLFVVFFAVVMLVYLLLNFWIGLRVWQYVFKFIPFTAKVYWPAFWLVALSYPAGRLGREFLSAEASRVLTSVGSYWLAFMVYFALALAALEIIRLLDRLTGVLPHRVAQNQPAPLAAGLLVLVLVIGTVAYGWWNARHPRVNQYSITIPKTAGDLRDLRVAAVSDLHLGPIVHNGRLMKLVEMMEEIKPDLILLPGDVIDENPGPFVEQDMVSTFRRLTPKYGIYAVPGNHDYYGRKSEEILMHLEGAGVSVLVDRHVKIADSFYLVGRDDFGRGRYDGNVRRELADLMQGIDRSLPVILMDHQPVQLDLVKDSGVDLKLSGHTHRGQLFPFNLITRMVYEIDWGYLRKGDLHVIVSSGFGTWGPPVRVGSVPEIVVVDLRFGPE